MKACANPARTYVRKDALGRTVFARAMCADGRVRSVKVRGARAQYSTSVSGRIVSLPDGVFFIEGKEQGR